MIKMNFSVELKMEVYLTNQADINAMDRSCSINYFLFWFKVQEKCVLGGRRGLEEVRLHGVQVAQVQISPTLNLLRFWTLKSNCNQNEYKYSTSLKICRKD